MSFAVLRNRFARAVGLSTSTADTVDPAKDTKDAPAKSGPLSLKIGHVEFDEDEITEFDLKPQVVAASDIDNPWDEEDLSLRPIFAMYNASLADLWKNRAVIWRYLCITAAVFPRCVRFLISATPMFTLALVGIHVVREIDYLLTSLGTQELVNVLSDHIKAGRIGTDTLFSPDVMRVLLAQMVTSLIGTIVLSALDPIDCAITGHVTSLIQEKILAKMTELDYTTYCLAQRRTHIEVQNHHSLLPVYPLVRSVLIFVTSLIRLASIFYLLMAIHPRVAMLVLAQQFVAYFFYVLLGPREPSDLHNRIQDAHYGQTLYFSSWGYKSHVVEESTNTMCSKHRASKMVKLSHAGLWLSDTKMYVDLCKKAGINLVEVLQRWPVVIFTSYQVLIGNTQIGQMATVIDTANNMVTSIINLKKEALSILKSGVTSRSLYVFLDTKPAIADPVNPVELDEILPPPKPAAMVSSTDIATEASHDVGISIEFRNVSFAYPDLRNEWEIRRAKQAKLEKKLTKKKDKAAAAAADSDDESDSDEEKVKWILKDVSFFVPAGQTVSIVGRNGCGKSTLIKLLTRIFDPAEGQILFNGIDIRKLKVEDLRSIVSVLEQSCKVMPGTIGHGISAGRIDSYAKMSREQRLSTVKHVAERCGFAKVLNDKSDHRGFDSFQGPYDYYNGGHIHFSGGEKQKLAIAKAIFRAGPDFITDNDETGEIGSDEDPLAGMKSARVIVFDEPAAALDAIADNEVQQELQRMVKTSDAVRAKAGMPVKRTALFISHRMSSSRTADRIIVLGDKGSVVEDGNHAELMKIPLEDSVYRKLFETQANSYTD